jgi:predicted nucleic acid-binding protein
LAGPALWLVTGDEDLLVIEVDLGVRIVAPAQALLVDTFCR